MCYRSDSVVPCRGGIQGSLGLVGIAAWAHSSWALGVGRRMLDELVLYAREKADVFGKVCDAPTFRFQFAQAEAKFRSARSFLVESWQRSEEHTSELQSLMRISYAVFCLKKKN